MNEYANIVKSNLETAITEIEEASELYLKNPKKDFTRKRKLDFKEMIRLILSMGGQSINRELMEYFSYDLGTPTTSAFVQQREKILPETFEALFKKFTKASVKPNKYNDYRLLAIDGSDLCISHNPKDEKTYFPNGENAKGFNLLHLNVIYDLCNKTYIDALIQSGRENNERQALLDMMKRSDSHEKTIVIGDRGYESYNIFEHINRKEWNYVIRIKDINSNGISSGLNLPLEDSFDEEIKLFLTRRQTNEIKANPEKYKFMPNNQVFDFLPPESKETYPMSFRIVRFPISENTYEVLVTNLSKNEFPIEKLKEIYHMRWGIETSFRELKYAIGLSHFHAKKVGHIKQEIFAKLTMYNFCEIITLNVVLRQKDRKHLYQVNFSIAITICLQYFKSKIDMPVIDVEALIQRNILPIRNGRSDPRKVKPKSSASFLYRVS
jgi:hypothetical protein